MAEKNPSSKAHVQTSCFTNSEHGLAHRRTDTVWEGEGSAPRLTRPHSKTKPRPGPFITCPDLFRESLASVLFTSPQHFQFYSTHEHRSLRLATPKSVSEAQRRARTTSLLQQLQHERCCAWRKQHITHNEQAGPARPTPPCAHSRGSEAHQERPDPCSTDHAQH